MLSDFNPIYQNDEFVTLTNKLKDTKKENLNAFILIYEKINSKTEKKNANAIGRQITLGLTDMAIHLQNYYIN